jgi:hypothetical protein
MKLGLQEGNFCKCNKPRETASSGTVRNNIYDTATCIIANHCLTLKRSTKKRISVDSIDKIMKINYVLDYTQL